MVGMTAVLDVAHVSLRFGGITALDDVSLSVEQSNLLAVVGPNGAGKTSLLNCITGAYRASSGHISFQGADITHAPAHTAAKRGIARTFQHNELFPQLTTLENLLLGRQTALDYGLSSARKSRRSSNSSSWRRTGNTRSVTCRTACRRSLVWRGPSPQSRRWCCSMSHRRG